MRTILGHVAMFACQAGALLFAGYMAQYSPQHRAAIAVAVYGPLSLFVALYARGLGLRWPWAYGIGSFFTSPVFGLVAVMIMKGLRK